jgi:hypothetical protein
MLPCALCPLTHPRPFTIYIYRDGSWTMAEQYWMKNEMLDVLRMKLWAWGTYWGNDGNTLRRKKNWKIPLSPTPKPKRHKNLPPRLHAGIDPSPIYLKHGELHNIETWIYFPSQNKYMLCHASLALCHTPLTPFLYIYIYSWLTDD